MRKLIVFLALIGASALFLGAAPTTASAANCSAWESTTYWDGYMNFDAAIGQCSGVNQVQFGINPCTGTACIGGWWDYNYVATYRAVGYYGNPTQNIVNGSSVASLTYFRAPWCVGQTHDVYTYFWFRIHAAGGIWGTWHQRWTNPYKIVC